MFEGYSSLENHYNGKFIERVRSNGYDTSHQWVAREKIHGTNFSVILTKDSITPCKRSGPIQPAETFFGYDIIMAKYSESFKSIQEDLAKSDQIASVQIFGEFAGDGIQKGVDYGKKDFYTFDVLVKYTDNRHSTFLDDVAMETFILRYKLKVAPLLGRGTFEDLIKTPNEFQIITHRYNSMYKADPHKANTREWELELPSDNICEGYVLKTCFPTFLPNGSRVAIKCKNSKFSEKAKSDRLIKPKAELSEIDTDVLQKFSEYVTENRVNNVISKIGTVTHKDFGKVMGWTIQDIFVEAAREGLELIHAENPDIVKKELTRLVQDMLRPAWVGLVNS
ncbi:RNA ligase [Pectobacterium bacteriophage PM2]|uniref:RNA ligase 2 n=1 Tax=Pectobacterium bacteriophage PM2 TaxID=1429794 RepID=A0A0A0Q0K7_9CAUD|nr:RNA ligase [Pectobacterium bacteriophage PM2]AHY25161.1 RNA ligase 2 [Pectobacterium bacteriophage PM2]